MLLVSRRSSKSNEIVNGAMFSPHSQANKEAHLELFRVFLALYLVEFKCFGGHFENEYQVCFEV